MSALLTGGCECGAIRYECSAAPIMAGHCHCGSCQKASGTGHASHMMVPRAALRITGEARFYERTADSGNTVRRAFCPSCGAPVYGESSGWPDVMTLRAGSLDDPELFRPGMVVYAARAPSWDHMDPELPSFPKMPER
jgi:hypothetical protein